MKVNYPDREDGYYGSVNQCVVYVCDIPDSGTNKKIKSWLTGIEEGDVCSGSVKTKD
jgi:hypothetical protein